MMDSDLISPDKMLDILDFGSDEPTILWSQLMRHEALLFLNEINNIVQVNWDKHENKEIKIIENLTFWSGSINTIKRPVFPDLTNNISIEGTFLQNLNKNPNFDPKVQFTIFFLLFYRAFPNLLLKL